MTPSLDLTPSFQLEKQLTALRATAKSRRVLCRAVSCVDININSGGILKIFLSYAHGDYSHARRLYDKLDSIPEVNVWFDKESLSPGQKWELEIRKEISSSRFFLLLLSNHSTKKKGFYQREIREALKILDEYPDNEIYLVPVRLDNCRPHFEQLNALQYVDLFPDWDAGFQKILKVFTNDPTSRMDHEKWRLEYVDGSSFELLDGIAGTRQNASGHHHSLFPLETTVILGDSNKEPPFNHSKHTTASWKIHIKEVPIDSYVRCFLLFGCLRHFGGLHSPAANDFVEIYLNDHPIDGFEIKIIPEGQTDFFHQRPFPDIPKLNPFSMCQNLYAWSIATTHLGTDPTAQILVRIASRTKWDIDYVGLLFELASPTKKNSGL